MDKLYMLSHEDISKLLKVILRLAKSNVYNDQLILKDTKENIIDYILALFVEKELPHIDKFIKYLKVANIDKSLIKTNIRDKLDTQLYTKISPVNKRVLNWISINE